MFVLVSRRGDRFRAVRRLAWVGTAREWLPEAHARGSCSPSGPCPGRASAPALPSPPWGQSPHYLEPRSLHLQNDLESAIFILFYLIACR